MKLKAILALFLLSIINVNASELTKFVGKYDASKCGPAKNAKAYVSVTYNPRGQENGVEIRMYSSDDAELVTIRVGKYRIPNPNFKLGNPVKETIIEGNIVRGTIEEQVSYVYGDGSVKVETFTTLAKTKDGKLSFRVVGTDGGFCLMAPIK